MNIITLFQVGNIEICIEILDMICTINAYYNIFFVFSILTDIKQNISKLITYLDNKNIINYDIIYHINKGMDIGPYLKQLQYVFCNYKPDSFNQIYNVKLG